MLGRHVLHRLPLQIVALLAGGHAREVARECRHVGGGLDGRFWSLAGTANCEFLAILPTVKPLM